MNVKDIRLLSYNSFFCSELIRYFLKGFDKEECDINLLYLLLPLVLYQDTRKILSYTKKNNFNDVFEDKDITHVAKYIERLKELTNDSLILICHKNYVTINQNILQLHYSKEISYTKYSQDSILREYYKSAYKLGALFTNSRTIDIYIKLRII